MKRASTMMKGFVLGTSLLMFRLPVDAQDVTVNIVSDNTWTVKDTNGNILGNTQNVCLNATAPSNCPTANATSYGYAGAAWTANLSTIPGATWMWAPNITGATSPAANAEFFFEKQFFLCGAAQDGTISVSADDFAEVFLNGATTPLVTSTNWSVLTTVTVPASKFAQGPNKIQVHVKNAANPPDCTSDQYQCNPAGVVLGASFSDVLNAWPTCTDKGMTFNVGQVEQLSCPPGQTGSMSQVCACFGTNSIWLGPFGNCATPPTTCTGNNGISFNVGQAETLPCPQGQTGSANRICQANGSWGPTNTSMCVSPPPTCTGTGGTIFSVGQTETLPCPAGQVGSPPLSHACQANGTWGPTSGSCTLPTTCPGCKCGAQDSTPPQTALCPSGTSCGSKRSRVCDGWWIFSHCDYIQTVDWFCLP